jgi:hypothetical protein
MTEKERLILDYIMGEETMTPEEKILISELRIRDYKKKIKEEQIIIKNLKNICQTA